MSWFDRRALRGKDAEKIDRIVDEVEKECELTGCSEDEKKRRAKEKIDKEFDYDLVVNIFQMN